MLDPTQGLGKNTSMRYLTLPPSPQLADAVEALWAYEGYQPPHSFERIFPTGTVEILLNLTDGNLRCHHPQTGQLKCQWQGLLVTGAHHSYQLVETAQQYAMLGVALKPGGAWRLFGVPSNELTDRHVPLGQILGPIAQVWTDQLLNLKDPIERLRHLDTLFRKRTRRPLHPSIAWAADQFVRYPDHARIAVIAEETGLSSRRFHHLFQREIGINPKSFARIRRFQSALARLQQSRGQSLSFSLLALETGYADQAHMIRDFKAYSGFTPSQYHALTLGCLSHVPHPEQDQMCPHPH